MLIGYKRGQGSVVLRVKIFDSSVSTGAGKTGLTSASSGLVISTIADNEASATTYTATGSTIESITTLGTYAAPTATKCRFKEVDATNHKGIYEIQIADARFAVTSAKSLMVSIVGASGAAECDVVIPLRDLDPYDSVRAGLMALPNAAANATGGLPANIIRGGTAQAGASGTITLDASASSTDDFYNGNLIQIVSGAGAGQSRIISDYVQSTKVASVGSNWATNPDNTSVFAICALPGVIAANTPTNFSSLSIDGSGRVDVAKVGGTTQTARDLGASVLLSSGTGTGQLDVTSGVVKASVTQVNGDATAAANLAKTTRVIGRGTAGGTPTTTSIPTSAFAPAGAAANQFKGRIITFDADTTTAALRGQATDITESTNAATPILTVTALTTAPVSGDTFSVT